jgi:ABC-type Fe3+ transport system substrate-binding protein
MWPDLPFVVGEEKATALIKRYAALKPAFLRCGEDARIASGEFAIFFLSCGDYGARTLQETGAPIAAQVVKDACIILHWYLYVPATSQRPALAHLFSAFMATPEGQAAYYRAARVSDVFWDTPSKKIFDAATQSGAQCVDIDGEFAQQHGAELQHYMLLFKQILGG